MDQPNFRPNSTLQFRNVRRGPSAYMYDHKNADIEEDRGKGDDCQGINSTDSEASGST